MGAMDSMRRAALGAMMAATACGTEVQGGESMTTPMSTSITASSSAGTSAEVTGSGDDDVSDETSSEKLDMPPVGSGGCEYIDFLFVVDNSQSMQTYQQALGEQFPDFIDAMFAAVPPNLDLHVGITTTDFDNQCSDAESTSGCQSSAALEDIQSHYRTPDSDPDGGNGTQGRLFRYGGLDYFAINADDDPTPLVEWFQEAAISAGEDGCTFEMPVAAAGWMADPANAATNDGFLRNEQALLVMFFLTDEPDKSVGSVAGYKQQIFASKPTCGDEACVFVSGLIPGCVPGVNQKLWQFMTSFGNDEPPWADIEMTANYSSVFGVALAEAIAAACAQVPVP
jgi:hypothetical protein